MSREGEGSGASITTKKSGVPEQHQTISRPTRKIVFPARTHITLYTDGCYSCLPVNVKVESLVCVGWSMQFSQLGSRVSYVPHLQHIALESRDKVPTNAGISQCIYI